MLDPQLPEPGSAADWLRYARSDLLLARAERQEGILTEMLCFHAQQSVEKALKAMLIHHGAPAPRTHDLALLLSRPGALEDVPDYLHQAVYLTVYAVLTRYPADVAPVDEQEYFKAVSSAEQVVAWVEHRISPPIT